MSNIRPSNLPIEETDLIGFVHTDRGIDGSAKFNLANVSSALNLDGMATQAPSNVAITGGTIDGTTVGATTPSTVAATTGTFSGNVAVGSNAVTISTGGNVTAIDTVQVNSGTIRTTLTYDTGVAVIGSYTNHPVSLRVNQTQVGQLTTTGLNSTAIGATTPSTGAFTTVTATGAADTIIGSESGTGSGTGGGVIAATASANGNASFGWRTNGVNRWVMDTVGTSDSESVRIRKLGTGAASVGTFSSTGLDVTGTISSTGALTVNSTAVSPIGLTLIGDNNSYNPRMVFKTGTGSSAGKLDWLDASSVLQARFSYNDSIGGAFEWKPGGSTNAMSLTSSGLAVTGALSSTTGATFATGSGSVGVGTASPNLNGNTRALTISSETTAGTTSAALDIKGVRSSDGSSGQITFYNGSSLNALINVARRGADNSGSIEIYTSNAGSLAERLRIDSSGNLLIATTSFPSAAHASATQIRVGLTGTVFSQNSAGLGLAGMNLIDNAYVRNSTGDFAYLTSAKASRVLCTSGNVYLQTSTGSDTSDAAVSFSSRAIISDTGLAVTGTQKLQNSVVVNSSTQSILTNSSDGIAGLCWIRNSNVGGQALVLWDASHGFTIVSQLGSIFTTSSPSATEIQLSLGGTNPYYIQAIAGATRNGDTLRVSAINNH
jgi:hypothetical protein